MTRVVPWAGTACACQATRIGHHQGKSDPDRGGNGRTVGGAEGSSHIAGQGCVIPGAPSERTDPPRRDAVPIGIGWEVDTGNGLPDPEGLAEAFLQLIETTVGEFDVDELLQVLADRCVEVLDVAASGVLLADGGSKLRVMAASDHRAELLEMFQIQNDEGPCLDCYRSGEASIAEAPNGGFARWPRFAAACAAAEFGSVIAVPLRVRRKMIGTLNLFGTAAQPALGLPKARIAQAMANMAAVGIEHGRISHEQSTLITQLETALDSRVSIEQAKGILAKHLDVDLNEAFRRLRHRSRNSRRLLTDVAQDAIDDMGRDYTADGD